MWYNTCMNIDKIRELFNAGKFVISSHCRVRMDERDIRISDIGNAIMNGEIIEEYNSADNPSCLINGKCTNEIFIHIVVTISKENLLLITVYFPDSNKFTDNFSRRL